MSPGDFNAFTIKYNVIVPRITTQITLYQPFDPKKSSGPSSPPFQTTALWDTGATKSVITQATAQALGLVPVGSTMVYHAGGSSPSDTYLVSILLPNNVGLPGVLVSECPNITGNFGVVIGMDIITRGDFAITNANGQTWMTFRIPSIQPVDYVVEANRILYAGVARNAPCPCGKLDGNGKPIKFKRCHGKVVGI
jgi:hypothetical protein